MEEEMAQFCEESKKLTSVVTEMEDTGAIDLDPAEVAEAHMALKDDDPPGYIEECEDTGILRTDEAWELADRARETEHLHMREVDKGEATVAQQRINGKVQLLPQNYPGAEPIDHVKELKEKTDAANLQREDTGRMESSEAWELADRADAFKHYHHRAVDTGTQEMSQRLINDHERRCAENDIYSPMEDKGEAATAEAMEQATRQVLGPDVQVKAERITQASTPVPMYAEEFDTGENLTPAAVKLAAKRKREEATSVIHELVDTGQMPSDQANELAERGHGQQEEAFGCVATTMVDRGDGLMYRNDDHARALAERGVKQEGNSHKLAMNLVDKGDCPGPDANDLAKRCDEEKPYSLYEKVIDHGEVEAEYFDPDLVSERARKDTERPKCVGGGGSQFMQDTAQFSADHVRRKLPDPETRFPSSDVDFYAPEETGRSLDTGSSMEAKAAAERFERRDRAATPDARAMGSNNVFTEAILDPPKPDPPCLEDFCAECPVSLACWSGSLDMAREK
jgi:hypothetical protein